MYSTADKECISLLNAINLLFVALKFHAIKSSPSRSNQNFYNTLDQKYFLNVQCKLLNRIDTKNLSVLIKVYVTPAMAVNQQDLIINFENTHLQRDSNE